MIICFDCTIRTKELMDEFLKSGQYKDYGEVISSAVENLSVLQKEIESKGAVVIGMEEKVSNREINPRRPYQPTLKGIFDSPKKVSKKEIRPESEKLLIPEIFKLDGFDEQPKRFAEMPSDSWEKGQPIPPECWIFGQYNKLLPVKATCRALVKMLREKPEGVPVDDGAKAIADEALTLGVFLSDLDQKNKLNRDEKLSTAFPASGENSEKGKLRFASQFVVSISKDKEDKDKKNIYGLPYELKMINLIKEDKFKILLTQAGWEFAKLRNPVLDNEQEKPSQKFSEDEINFLLNHISQNVPVEDFAFRSILKAILDGGVNPTKIDDVLMGQLARGSGIRGINPSFLSTQRAGAISRMSDLELIERIWEGVKVIYSVSSEGQNYIKRL